MDSAILALLRALNEATEAWTYGMDLATRAGVSRSGLYLYLAEMEGERLILGREGPLPPAPRLPRRQYQITSLGRARLSTALREVGDG